MPVQKKISNHLGILTGVQTIWNPSLMSSWPQNNISDLVQYSSASLPSVLHRFRRLQRRLKAWKPDYYRIIVNLISAYFKHLYRGKPLMLRISTLLSISRRSRFAHLFSFCRSIKTHLWHSTSFIHEICYSLDDKMTEPTKEIFAANKSFLSYNFKFIL